MPKALLDTDIFSDLLRDKGTTVRTRANAYLAHERRITVSAITVLEVVKGLRQMNRDRELERFLKALPSIEVLPIGTDEAVEAGRIHADLARLGRSPGRADPVVAAVAIVHGLVLITGNEAHYRRIQDLPRRLTLDNWRMAEVTQ